MSKILSIHSFRGGTGKSNTTANIAYHMACAGLRVGVVDTDIQSPGIHILFGLSANDITHPLNNYLRGEGHIRDVAIDVTPETTRHRHGKVFLIPSSARADHIVDVLREGYDVDRLTDGLRQLIEDLSLDILLIDTHPGLNEETLFSIAISTALIVVMRPDHQDFEGTGVTVEVARSLKIPDLSIIVNRLPPAMDKEHVRHHVQQAYGVEKVSVLPHVEEMMNLASANVFSVSYPDHALSAAYRRLATDWLA